jgi:voltage-gated potassium channel
MEDGRSHVPVVHAASTRSWKPLAAPLLRTLLVIVALIALYAALPLRGRGWWIGATVGLVALGAVFPLAIRQARSILTSPLPMIDALAAIALLFTILVLGFSAVYYAVARNPEQFVDLRTRLDAVYFATATVSTVGYGDVSASGQAARAVATSQIVFDFVFIGVAIRLVSRAAQHRVENRDASSGG